MIADMKSLPTWAIILIALAVYVVTLLGIKWIHHKIIKRRLPEQESKFGLVKKVPGVNITNSYATGNVYAGERSSNVGGFIGGIGEGIREINVEFFEERPPTSWYRDKIESAREVWAAYLGGGTMDSAAILNSKKFRKLVLLNPESKALKAIKEMESEQPIDVLQDRIRRNTTKALSLNCCVRWCDDITYSLLTIGNPPVEGHTPPSDMWVIVETYLAGIEAEKRPSIFIEWRKNPKMAEKGISSFLKVWKHSKRPNLPNSGKEGSQS